MNTSKSPRKVILAALAVGKDALPEYSHPCSPKVFTQPQLFACLALMVFVRTDYRGIEAYIRDFTAIARWLGLSRVPDHSTLHKAAQRFFGAAVSDKLLAASLRRLMKRRRVIPCIAADSTGLESGHRSPYFVRRRQRGQRGSKNPLYQTTSYRRYPKLTMLVDCGTHAALALLTGRGPRPDITELAPLLKRLPRGIAPVCLLADAGFDSEPNHVLARETHGIRSLMPATYGRPSKHGRPPTGKWRRRMSRLLRTKRQRRRSGYTQRWQVETVVSMIKRNLGDALSATTYQSQCRELRRLVIVHNTMILLCGREVFDRALPTPFPVPPFPVPDPFSVPIARRSKGPPRAWLRGRFSPMRPCRLQCRSLQPGTGHGGTRTDQEGTSCRIGDAARPRGGTRGSRGPARACGGEAA